MNLKKSEQIETNLYELEFSVDRATFDAAVDRVYRKQAKNINIPGFRRGKAPRAIIEKMYGAGVFYEDAVNDIIPAAYQDAVKEAALKTVSQPEFEVVSIDEEGVVLKAKVYVKPEVNIADYKGIKATRKVTPVTAEDVDREIEQVRERNARTVDVTDRAAQTDDIVNIDYDGYLDGKPFEGGKAEGHALKLGSGQFIPGFEEQVVGHQIGEKFEINVTFPEEYHADELAGKPVVFKIKLNGIQYNELPALDDEFAKDVSDFDTLDEYKADIKAKMEERNAKAADAEVEEQIINTLIEKLEADIPAAMIDTETENAVRDYDNRLRMQGLDLSMYFKYSGQNLDTLRENFRPQAERQVKTRLALEKIAQLEQIEATEEDINGEYANIAAAYNMEQEKIRELIDAESIAEDMKVKKAVDFVKANAKITEDAPAAKKTTAKKTTAKKAAAPAEKTADKAKKAAAPAEKTADKAKESDTAPAKAPAKKTTAKKTTAKKTTAKKTDAAE